MNKADEIKLDKKLTVYVLLMIFTIGGIFGFVYEELFYRVDLGYFVKRGTTIGPWIPIYGFGALLIAAVTYRVKKIPAAVFAISALVTGALELVTGFVLDSCFGKRLWDYNTEIWNFGNIGGYVCLRSVLFFGVSALLLQYIIHPYLDKFAAKCPLKVLTVVTVIPSGLFLLDITLAGYGVFSRAN